MKSKFKYTGTFEVSGYKMETKTVTHFCECRSFYEAFILLSAFAIDQADNYQLKAITDNSGHKVLVKDAWDVNPFHLPIKFNGKEYVAIEKFDCHTIDLTLPHGSGYCTVLPISPADYRRKTPTKAKVRITETIEGYVSFWCYDDLGYAHVIDIPKHMEKEIETATQAAKDFELLQTEATI